MLSASLEVFEQSLVIERFLTFFMMIEVIIARNPLTCLLFLFVPAALPKPCSIFFYFFFLYPCTACRLPKLFFSLPQIFSQPYFL
ncbi:hypothetical protein PRUPE_7G027700 [Prunus persica]|uniref:Uncharacterized protein n=1 Tax=Prunus persica TaxID=3760 RepID=A0A251N615_PRUPE|nr:hypothetical protein PRUPE_7G027700 [Prunus persica]